MWPAPDDTQQLLQHARAGDAQAVNELLERHRAALRRAVELRMDPVLQRRVDASDIVQDVLIDASRRLQNYLANPTLPFAVWLKHLARDRVIDAHRRHRVAGRRSLDKEQPLVVDSPSENSAADLGQQIADSELTPAAAAAWNEMERRFLAALDAADEQDRQIVMLRHFEQLSNQEVAQTLGLSEAAAGMRYLRAMRRVRARLEADSRRPSTP